MEKEGASGANGDTRAIEGIAEECNYKPSRLARTLGLSLRQFERIWKQKFQKSPHIWLEELRLRRARRMLLEGRSIKETLFKLGYKQLSHFTRRFKANTGMTPGNFVRLHGAPSKQFPRAFPKMSRSGKSMSR